MAEKFLTLAGVSKGFGKGVNRHEVLNDVNLEVARGECVAIVGFSGAGKTTLISLLSGLARADRGEVRMNGRLITEPSPERGVVFQNYSLLPWLTVFGNILLAVEQVFGDWTAERKRAHVEEYIALVNLTPARNKYPKELSGGMRQRVSVARALAMKPEVLLLDEPLSALDALTRGTLQDEIERISRTLKNTIVLITNSVDEALLLADRIVPLSPGPRATLGPAFVVNIERPRDRRAMNHHPEFQRLRAEITHYLLSLRKKPGAAAAENDLRRPKIDAVPIELTPAPRRRPVLTAV